MTGNESHGYPHADRDVVNAAIQQIRCQTQAGLFVEFDDGHDVWGTHRAMTEGVPADSSDAIITVRLDIIRDYRQIGCGTISFVHQHFYHVARLVYIPVSWLGRTVATESSDAAASRRPRHHDSGVVAPARRDAHTARRPESRLPPTNIWQDARPATSVHGAGGSHPFRHCDVLTLNSSAAQVLPNRSARSRSRPRRAACWPSPGRGLCVRILGPRSGAAPPRGCRRASGWHCEAASRSCPSHYGGAGPTSSRRKTGPAQRLSSSRLRLATGGLASTDLVAASPMTNASVSAIRCR
jgi:hypothetical protein